MHFIVLSEHLQLIHTYMHTYPRYLLCSYKFRWIVHRFVEASMEDLSSLMAFKLLNIDREMKRQQPTDQKIDANFEATGLQIFQTHSIIKGSRIRRTRKSVESLLNVPCTSSNCLHRSKNINRKCLFRECRKIYIANYRKSLSRKCMDKARIE